MHHGFHFDVSETTCVVSYQKITKKLEIEVVLVLGIEREPCSSSRGRVFNWVTKKSYFKIELLPKIVIIDYQSPGNGSVKR
jgi:hypothetical protein